MEFEQTVRGVQFFDHDMPRLVRAMETIANKMETNAKQESAPQMWNCMMLADDSKDSVVCVGDVVHGTAEQASHWVIMRHCGLTDSGWHPDITDSNLLIAMSKLSCSNVGFRVVYKMNDKVITLIVCSDH